MARFDNKMNITCIRMSATTRCFCPIGKAPYTAELEVEMVPGSTIPDYIEVEQFVNSGDGASLVIEELVAAVADYLQAEYNPARVTVRAAVKDAKHFPVVVEKSI